MRLAVQAGEHGQCDRGKQILRRQREMGDAVVDRTEAGFDQVRIRECGTQREQHRDSTGVHVAARHRKNMPASPTPPPAMRKAIWPAGQRWIAPIAMPIACRHPVAMTNPRLYRSPLWPGGNSVPWAWP